MTAPRRWLALVAALCLGALAVSPALAHASLVTSTPADGASVLLAEATAVSLVFDDDLDAAKSKVELVDAGGTTVATGRVSDDPKTMRAAGLSLAAGDYQARWTAVASDGDITRGVVTFRVVAATSSAAAPTSASAAGPIATTPPNPDAGPTDVIVPIVAGLAVVVVAGALLLRRTRAA